MLQEKNHQTLQNLRPFKKCLSVSKSIWGDIHEPRAPSHRHVKWSAKALREIHAERMSL